MKIIASILFGMLCQSKQCLLIYVLARLVIPDFPSCLRRPTACPRDPV